MSETILITGPRETLQNTVGKAIDDFYKGKGRSVSRFRWGFHSSEQVEEAQKSSQIVIVQIPGDRDDYLDLEWDVFIEISINDGVPF